MINIEAKERISNSPPRAEFEEDYVRILDIRFSEFLLPQDSRDDACELGSQ